MKNNKILLTILFTSLTSLTLTCLTAFSKRVHASTLEQKGTVTVQDPGTSKLIDPEHPEQEVDPGSGPSTEGELRIDFVSTLNFGSKKIEQEDRFYASLAQLFHSETEARGYYIQVSDFRSKASGWNLTLTQETQFRNSIIQEQDQQELKGAVLSFDKGWANTSGSSGIPNVTRDTMAINNMNTAYTVASAGDGQGKGNWTVSFGASDKNTSGQENTLTALTSGENSRVIDSTYHKPMYSNSAVSLTVPEATKIYPVQYTTTLTWSIEAVPTQ